MTPFQARLSILGAAALWSSAGAAIKLCQLNGWQIAGLRSLVAALFLVVFVPETRRVPGRRTLLVAVANAFTPICFVMATKLTTAANAIFIQDVAPLFVLLLGPLFLREYPTRSELLALPVFAAGLGLFFLDDLSPGQATGNLVALGSALAFAFSIIGMRSLKGEATTSLLWGNLFAAAVALPFWGTGPEPRAVDLGIVAALGVFQLGVSYTLFTRGLARTPAVEASLLVLLEPVLNPVWTFLFAGEVPGRWALLGGALVLAATAWRAVEPLLARRGAGRAAEPDRVPGVPVAAVDEVEPAAR